MSYSGSDLLTLQHQIKTDPQGYKDEFKLQWRHYQATRSLFLMAPSHSSLEFQSLVMFMAHVGENFPDIASSFTNEVVELLQKHGAVLEHSTRLTLVKALILMRNKSQIQSTELLKVLFGLFPVPDKSLRHMMSRHITADIKGANKKGRNEQFNRKMQNILIPIIEHDDEICAKRALAILTDMWRRQVWRDARAANAIAKAAFHPSYRVMLSSLKFFLGQDDREPDDDEDSEDEDVGQIAQPTKEQIYKAFHKGTTSSKKKKQKKLKRAMASVKKNIKREEGQQRETFAAIQLLHDPHEFAEKLFSRLRSGSERAETRLMMVSVISRVIGVHKLMMINFYPYLQKYISPSRPEITSVLAALIQSCHDQVPPDVLAPVLRQLVDQFVHDKARPEVITVGIKTVRELCLRAPLIMTPELLQELVDYKKFRDKEVATSARALLGLFREISPGMLLKKDRGRLVAGEVKSHVIAEYGASTIADRIEGAELLARDPGSDLEDDSTDEEVDGVEVEEEDAVEVEEEDGVEVEEEDAVEVEEEDAVEVEEEDAVEVEEEDGVEVEEEDGVEVEEEDGVEVEHEQEDNVPTEDEDSQDAIEGEEIHESPSDGQLPSSKLQPKPQKESLKTLKKQLQSLEEKNPDEDTTDMPIEWGRILSQEDFQRIKELKHKKFVEDAMKKHGLKSASKRAAALEVAEQEAEEYLDMQQKRSKLHEHAVNPDDLLGKRRGKLDKQERLASVLEGREGREFGAKARIKKSKTGGLSNREKQKRKFVPTAAVSGQVRKRLVKHKMKSAKNFKGHVRK